jgi:hypothetical protein
MTPKEKAKELVDKFRGILVYGQRQWGQVHFAKQCAIITCQEILSLKMVYNMGRDENYNEGTFYEEVIQEIEKL